MQVTNYLRYFYQIGIDLIANACKELEHLALPNYLKLPPDLKGKLPKLKTFGGAKLEQGISEEFYAS